MVYRHHIIPLHEWKRRINPAAGRGNREFNAPDNVVWLSLEQHIQAHQLLHELNNSEFDRIAWTLLSGQIGIEEGISRATSFANKGRKLGPPTVDHRAKLAASRRGLKHSPQTLAKMSRTRLGRKHTPETRKKIAESQIGKSKGKRTEEQNKANSLRQIGVPKPRKSKMPH